MFLSFFSINVLADVLIWNQFINKNVKMFSSYASTFLETKRFMFEWFSIVHLRNTSRSEAITVHCVNLGFGHSQALPRANLFHAYRLPRCLPWKEAECTRAIWAMIWVNQACLGSNWWGHQSKVDLANQVRCVLGAYWSLNLRYWFHPIWKFASPLLTKNYSCVMWVLHGATLTLNVGWSALQHIELLLLGWATLVPWTREEQPSWMSLSRGFISWKPQRRARLFINTAFMYHIPVGLKRELQKSLMFVPNQFRFKT